MESAPACISAETNPDSSAASAGKNNIVVYWYKHLLLFDYVKRCCCVSFCYCVYTEDVLALCMYVVLQKWVAEDVVVHH